MIDKPECKCGGGYGFYFSEDGSEEIYCDCPKGIELRKRDQPPTKKETDKPS